ncbi:hypothetical protein [Methylobacterium sp. WL116]|uniref:hypothetical protein n=1 Tax=Methylobacterium sp. WL116 TaxID=2603889 RepID=UPI0011C8EC64|nr:hypothetical protein [Methylobacterium sp. WL116]TXM92633.1 hypothetical protein FV223_11140 [Methylobacterium sp. WL116]
MMGPHVIPDEIDAKLTRMAERPIYTMDHLRNRAVAEFEEVRRERLWAEGSRKARRKAAARAWKGIVAEPSASDLTDAIRATFAAAEAEVARNRRIAEHMERTREWQAVQALQGRIIDKLLPEERAARDAAASAESDRAEAEYASRRQS